MDTTPTVLIGQPPPFPAPHRTIDFSPFKFILGFIAVISMPALIYTLLFAIKCPPNPFRRRSSGQLSGVQENAISESVTKEVASDVKYRKDELGEGVDSACPVCLCAFSDGEEVRQLSACKHSFHGFCIDQWLNSHSNCPVCRAFVAVKRHNSSSSDGGEIDLHQGLPDAASLV